MDMLKKILSIVIIILFIGIGIQPAFAVDTNTSVVNQQSEEVCECQVVNRSNRVSSLICDILETILNNTMERIEKYIEKYEDALEAGKTRLASLYYILVILCFHSVEYIFFMLEKFDCWGPP